MVLICHVSLQLLQHLAAQGDPGGMPPGAFPQGLPPGLMQVIRSCRT
jgi:hypothetical protein